MTQKVRHFVFVIIWTKCTPTDKNSFTRGFPMKFLYEIVCFAQYHVKFGN